MFVALAAAVWLAVDQNSSDALQHRGVWAAITVTLALEVNVGATVRKASLRAAGTFAGGALGLLCVAITGAANDGWAGGAPPGKVAVMVVVVGAAGAVVQAARARDPTRDYAYQCTTMTLVLTCLSEFEEADVSLVMKNVFWRCVCFLTPSLSIACFLARVLSIHL